MYAPVLSNYWADLIFLLHTERAYVVAVRRRVIFDFSSKLPKLRDAELRHFSAFQWSRRVSLYAPVLSNYCAYLILLLHIDRAHVGAVRRTVIIDFSSKLPKLRDAELVHFSAFQRLRRVSLYAPVLSNYYA